MSRTVHQIGDEVVCAIAIRNAAGLLVDPTRATATLKAPDDTIYVDDDGSLRLAVTIGLPTGDTVAVNTDAETNLGITNTENQAGTGIVTAAFIPDTAGPWQLELHAEGPEVQETEQFSISVPKLRSGRAYTGNKEVA